MSNRDRADPSMECLLLNGIVNWFNSKKGYGFILPEGTSEGQGKDVFVHFSSIVAEENTFRTLYHGEKVDERIRNLLDIDIKKFCIHTRAGNKVLTKAPERRRGGIHCSRKFKQSVLLPNGDVLLCCMDYGMKHVLGNLLKSEYTSLFRSE